MWTIFSDIQSRMPPLNSPLPWVALCNYNMHYAMHVHVRPDIIVHRADSELAHDNGRCRYKVKKCFIGWAQT